MATIAPVASPSPSPRPARGFSLVELMIVVAIVGVLSALAVNGVRRYVTNAKQAEMRNVLGVIARAGVVAYEVEKPLTTGVATPGSTVATAAKVFCSNATMVPSPDRVRGTKYQSAPSEWQTGSASAGWKCLRFSLDVPQYYAYGYVATQEVGAGTFCANSRGDLDGDGNTSEFQLNGEATAGVVRIAPVLREVYPDRE